MAHENYSLWLLWHLQKGHLGYDNLKLLNDKSMVNGMSVSTNEVFDWNCEGSLIGKQQWKSENNTSQLLELIYSDIVVPWMLIQWEVQNTL